MMLFGVLFPDRFVSFALFFWARAKHDSFVLGLFWRVVERFNSVWFFCVKGSVLLHG